MPHHVESYVPNRLLAASHVVSIIACGSASSVPSAAAVDPDGAWTKVDFPGGSTTSWRMSPPRMSGREAR